MKKSEKLKNREFNMNFFTEEEVWNIQALGFSDKIFNKSLLKINSKICELDEWIVDAEIIGDILKKITNKIFSK